MLELHFNPAMLEQLKRSPELKARTKTTADAIADHVRAMNIQVGDLDDNGFENLISIPVDVSDDNEVILAHPAGVAVQAKYGALTKAAAEVGLRAGGG